MGAGAMTTSAATPAVVASLDCTKLAYCLQATSSDEGSRHWHQWHAAGCDQRIKQQGVPCSHACEHPAGGQSCSMGGGGTGSVRFHRGGRWPSTASRLVGTICVTAIIAGYPPASSAAASCWCCCSPALVPHWHPSAPSILPVHLAHCAARDDPTTRALPWLLTDTRVHWQERRARSWHSNRAGVASH